MMSGELQTKDMIMKEKRNSLVKLQAQLKHFGLNPSEWNLRRVQSLSFLIQHKLDKGYAFYGRLENSGPQGKWRSLELLSL